MNDKTPAARLADFNARIDANPNLDEAAKRWAKRCEADHAASMESAARDKAVAAFMGWKPTP